MNYLRKYIDIIRKAQRTEYTSYCERHHVFPKSIFGNNCYTVKMSAREHYVAHALLEKIYIKRYGENNPNTKKMVRAFFMMNNAHGIGQHRYVNSRLFEASKIRFSQQMSGKNSPMYGKNRLFTEQHLANLRLSRKVGKDNPLFGIPRSEEVKAKMRKPKHSNHGKLVSKSRTGMKFSEEHKKNLSLSHLGNVPTNKGKSKLLFELVLPSGVTTTLNGCELRIFAKEQKLNIKGMKIASRTTEQFKEYKIKDISDRGSK